MDVRLVNPFIFSVTEVFYTMAGTELMRKGTHLKKARENCYGDISGVIGFAGDITGNLAISFPKDVAISIVGKMIGDKVEWGDILLKEGISEVANMIAGSTKNKIYTELNYHYHISLPSIVTGANHYISHPSNMKVIIIEFEKKDEPSAPLITLELCVKKE